MAMNWGRGLTRIYVVLWVVVAIVTALMFPIERTSTLLDGHRRFKEFAAAVKAPIAGKDLQDLTVDSLAARLLSVKLGGPVSTAVVTEQRDLLRAHGKEVGDLDYVELDALHGISHDSNLEHPAGAIAESWALWLGLAVLAPSVVLAIIRWIAAGFSSKT